MDDELTSQIPQNAKEFRYENLVFKYTKSRDTNTITGYVIKNTETPYTHYHFYHKDGKLFLHQSLYDKEKKQRIPVDVNVELQKLKENIENFFRKAELIEISDVRFVGKQIVTIQKFDLGVDQIKGRKIYFDHNYELAECLFENIEVSKNMFGIIFQDDVETHMIIIKDRQIAVIDLKYLDEIDGDG